MVNAGREPRDRSASPAERTTSAPEEHAIELIARRREPGETAARHPSRHAGKEVRLPAQAVLVRATGHDPSCSSEPHSSSLLPTATAPSRGGAGRRTTRRRQPRSRLPPSSGQHAMKLGDLRQRPSRVPARRSGAAAEHPAPRGPVPTSRSHPVLRTPHLIARLDTRPGPAPHDVTALALVPPDRPSARAITT